MNKGRLLENLIAIYLKRNELENNGKIYYYKENTV